MASLPRTATHTEANLLAWIIQQLEERPKAKLPNINLSRICKYDLKYGFKLAIDGATNLSRSGFKIAVTSLSKMRFRLDHQLPESEHPNDLIYTKSLDYQSKIKHPQWNDGFVWYRNRPLDPEFIIFIEVFAISDNDVTACGWACLNPFTSLGSVRNGRFQLPLFQNDPKSKILTYWKCSDPEFGIDRAMAEGNVDLGSGCPWISVRLADGRRADEVTLDSPSNQDFLGSYASKYSGPGGWSTSRFSSLVGRKKDESSFDRSIYEAFISRTHLPYIP